MYNDTELNQRLVIIKHSNLDDIIILDENYKQFIKNTPDPEEKKQYGILHSIIQNRIKQLRGNSGDIHI